MISTYISRALLLDAIEAQQTEFVKVSMHSRTVQIEADDRDEWQRVMDDLRAGNYGEWEQIRQRICDEWQVFAPGHGLSSSDINHLAFQKVKNGDLTLVA